MIKSGEGEVEVPCLNLLLVFNAPMLFPVKQTQTDKEATIQISKILAGRLLPSRHGKVWEFLPLFSLDSP